MLLAFKVLGAADHAVVKARAHGKKNIAVLHGHIGFVRAVHPHHAKELVAAAVKGAEPHERAHNRVTGELHEAVHKLACLGARGAAADIKERTLGREQHLHRLFDLAAVAARHGPVACDVAGFGVLKFGDGALHVLGKVHENGTGTARAGDVKGLFDGFGKLGDVLNEEVVLDAGSSDADRVAFLEGVGADQARSHLARKDNHGNRVGIGRGNARDGVGGAGAARDQSHADFVRAARVGVCGMHRGLLVANEDVTEVFLLVDFVVDGQNGAARVPENVFDAFGVKRFDENARAAHAFGCRLLVLSCLHGKDPFFCVRHPGQRGRPCGKGCRLVTDRGERRARRLSLVQDRRETIRRTSVW